MHLSILLPCTALASASPLTWGTSDSGPPTITVTVAPMPSSISWIGDAASISSYIASPSFVPYSMPTEDVVEWIALGDSYTAGVGSNGQNELIGGDAGRGQRSAPIQMNDDTDAWGFINQHTSIPPARFSFSAHTGDKFADLIVKQLKDGSWSPNNLNEPRHAFGAPQLAIMTIGGNDAYFAEIINACFYRVGFGLDSCDQTLDKLQGDITSGLFREKVLRALFDVAEYGRKQNGANPRESFQVYISEYVPFFDAESLPCDEYSWEWYPPYNNYLTRDLRYRLNDLVYQLNGEIGRAAGDLRNMGVIFVTGIGAQYRAGDHLFCSEGHDKTFAMTDKDTWFWSAWQPSSSDTEGPESQDANTFVNPLNNTVLQAVLDFAFGEGATTVETYKSSPYYTDPSLTGYKSLEELMDAMANAKPAELEPYRFLFLSTLRSMHPKGSAYKIHAEAFLEAIADHRGP